MIAVVIETTLSGIVKPSTIMLGLFVTVRGLSTIAEVVLEVKLNNLWNSE